MNIFELAAKLALDSSDYIKGINEAEKATSSSNDKIKDSVKKTTDSYNQGLKTAESSSNNFGQALKKGIVVAAGLTTAALTATTAAAAAVTKTFIKGVKEAADYGDTVDKQSQKVGFSAKAWQEWDYVLNLAGADMKSATMGIKTLTNQVDAAKKGNKDAIANFKALGISVKSLKNLSREEIFEKVISQLQKMPESANRAAIANKLLGRSGQELSALFNMSNEETKKAIQNANDYNMIMSDQGVKASASYKDSLTTLEGALRGLKNSMMTEFMPGLTSIAEGLSNVFSGRGSDKLKEGVSLFLVELRRVGPDILKIISDVGTSLIKGLGPMLPSVVSTIFSLLTQAITTVSSMTPQLIPIIIEGIKGAASALMQALPVIIDGLTQLLLSLANWLSDGNNVQLMVSGIVQLVTQLVNSFALILPPLIVAIATIVGQLAEALTQPDNVQMLLQAVLTIIGALAVGIVKALPILVKAVTNVVKNLGELLGRFFEKAVPLVAEGIGNLVNKVKTLGNNIKTSVTKFFSEGLSNLGKFVTDIINKIKELPGKVVSIGSDIVKGLWNGISNMSKWIGEKIKSFGSGVLKGLKDFFKIKSPSRLFRDEIGKFLALGVGEGFEIAMPKTVSGMVDEAKKATQQIADVISAGDTQAAFSGSVTKVGTSSAGSLSIGPMTFNLYAAEGQDVREMAKAVAREIQNMIDDKEKVYA